MTRQSRPSALRGHLCWAYDDPASFEARARDFLVEGLAAGERVLHSTAGRPEALVERWGDIPGFAEAVHRGAAQLVPLTATYGDDGAVDPAAQVAVYAAATEKALADGFAGLRVIADATSLARTPAQRDAFARYEHLIDRYMNVRPMSALCGYDRRELGEQGVAELACMHPESNADEVLFHLHGCDPADGAAALAGELDTSNHELFSTALERADLRPVDGRLVVQAAHLHFIDYRALTHLQDHAARWGATAVLRTPLSAAARLIEMLGLSRVLVEAPR